MRTRDHLFLRGAEGVAEARHLRPEALPVHYVRDQLALQRGALRPQLPRRLQLACSLVSEDVRVGVPWDAFNAPTVLRNCLVAGHWVAQTVDGDMVSLSKP